MTIALTIAEKIGLEHFRSRPPSFEGEGDSPPIFCVLLPIDVSYTPTKFRTRGWFRTRDISDFSFGRFAHHNEIFVFEMYVVVSLLTRKFETTTESVDTLHTLRGRSRWFVKPSRKSGKRAKVGRCELI